MPFQLGDHLTRKSFSGNPMRLYRISGWNFRYYRQSMHSWLNYGTSAFPSGSCSLRLRHFDDSIPLKYRCGIDLQIFWIFRTLISLNHCTLWNSCFKSIVSFQFAFLGSPCGLSIFRILWFAPSEIFHPGEIQNRDLESDSTVGCHHCIWISRTQAGLSDHGLTGILRIRRICSSGISFKFGISFRSSPFWRFSPACSSIFPDFHAGGIWIGKRNIWTFQGSGLEWNPWNRITETDCHLSSGISLRDSTVKLISPFQVFTSVTHVLSESAFQVSPLDLYHLSVRSVCGSPLIGIFCVDEAFLIGYHLL